MAQHDQNIANDSGANVRSDINSALAAIFGLSSGTTAPSTTIAYMLWADTTTGLIKQRNAANSAWVTIGTMADTNWGLLSKAGGTLTGLLTTLASASGGAGINLPHGSAPSAPSNGDLWTTTAGLFARINGATQQLGSFGFKLGSFTRDISLSSGNQAVTGVGFQPRLLLVFGGIDTTSSATFLGMADGTTTGSVGDNNPSSGGTFRVTTNLITLVAAGPSSYIGVLNSFDSDGFTIGWTKNSTPTGTATIYYLAIR